MDKKWTIAVDAMGGDNAPLSVIAGLDIVYDYLVENGISLLVFGDTKQLDPLFERYPRVREISSVIHTEEVIHGDDKPSKVISKLRGRGTSMWMAIEAVRNKQADAVVSGGNTGCLMAISKLLISTIEGIKRPAITTLLPNSFDFTVMLDLGANVECDEHNLVQFAIMGSLYAKALLGKERPKVGILNVGSEAHKGLDYLTKTEEIFAEKKTDLPFDYYGFVEGDDITKNKVDVITTDGFSGNIALKSIEGTAKFISSELRKVFTSSWLSKFGYLFMYGAVKKFKSRIDPRKYNGAVMLGLNGVVVKSHGGTDAVGFSNAVLYASKLLVNNFIPKIESEIEKLK